MKKAWGLGLGSTSENVIHNAQNCLPAATENGEKRALKKIQRLSYKNRSLAHREVPQIRFGA
jgi:hypothetical protein